jgi:hypothetical protein
LSENKEADAESIKGKQLENSIWSIFSEKKKEVESKVTPIISKLYQGGAPPTGGEENTNQEEKDEL